MEVNRLENVADVLLRRSVAGLFETLRDPVDVLKWKEIYETLEAVTDRCEDVTDVDVKMPVLDGYEFLRALRARTEFRSIPVILMSGTDRPRSLSAGCRAFFSKPLDFDMLLRLARQLARRATTPAGPAHNGDE